MPPELFTDRQRLRQVVSNLLSNAVKFTEQGTVTLSVATAQQDVSRVVFTVSDTGIGIAQENLAAIFGAFEQGDATLSRRYGGTGLGLSIAREVTALLGGKITADSVLGQGTTFALWVPCTLPEAAGRDCLDKPADVSPPRNLLIYERTGDGVCSLLAHSAAAGLDAGNGGVTISTATVPEQGAALLAAEPVRCVVAHLGAPSAIEFLEQVQQEPALRHIPVLAYANEEDHADVQPRLGALRSGGMQVEVLSSPGDLRECIMAHLSPGGHTVLRGKKVLVIDDDERNVFAVGSALELHGVTVVQAANGRAGIDTLIATPDIDVVLLDLMMPGMDGYATLAVLRQMPQFADLPVVVVTARATPADRDRSLQAGASDCITKLVDVDGLLACVERLLTSSCEDMPLP